MPPAQDQKSTRKSATPTKGPTAPQRPVRFVTNNDEPLSKRRRISAACRTCQRKKTKCSGEKPDCSTCLESDALCLGYAQHNHVTRKGNKVAKISPIEDKFKRSESQLRSPKALPDSQGPDRSIDNAHLKELQPNRHLQPATSDDLSFSIDGISNDFKPGATSSLNGPREYRIHYRSRVPYFRYFGPTAMVPGFKQMVVDLNHHPELEPVNGAFTTMEGADKIVDGSETSHRRTSSPSSPAIPVYTKNDRTPINPLIEELCEDFFTHLGGNYPFLTRDTFMRDLQQRHVETILVDAVCAIAARFSKNSTIVKAGRTVKCDEKCADRTHKSKYGSVFARRAMSAIIDFFACPTLAAVQACLLLAYEQFGADHDSGLWIYLGLSIRMAQDLGMQKLEGLEYEGYLGPTPKTAKSGPAGQAEEKRRAERYYALQAQLPVDEERSKKQRISEKERVNTFWAIFFLDRVVSSGTGRPVTLRDKDIEISFPTEEESDDFIKWPAESDDSKRWPAPFPALIRIVHSYGRVANLLNNIREANQLTPDIMKQLVAAEDDLIGIYQRLSPKLYFSAANFQHYLKQSQATNFILLHFWFHTLIVLLHQPTLLHSFEGRIQQLFPNSQELSLSSAKTIADILSFAELLDSKSFIGNPFTSQPMYFAACAFLLESVSHSISRPQSRLGTPPVTPLWSSSGTNLTVKSQQLPNGGASDMNNSFHRSENKPAHAKRGLLAAAASQNYQRCYRALKALETYWAGTRYIVTVLDQKAKGSLDPLLYTDEYLGDAGSQAGEKGQSSQENGSNPAEPVQDAPTEPLNTAHQYAHLAKLKSAVGPRLESLSSSKGAEASQAIGWSLTGSSDSAGSNLSVLYQTARDEVAPPAMVPRIPNTVSEYQSPEFAKGTVLENASINSQKCADVGLGRDISLFGNDSVPMTNAPNNSHISPLTNAATLTSLLSDYLSTSSPQMASMQPPRSETSQLESPQPNLGERTPLITTNHLFLNTSPSGILNPSMSGHSQDYGPSSQANHGFNNMIIESQDIDASALGLDPLLWLDFMPQNILDSFELQNEVPADANLGN